MSALQQQVKHLEQSLQSTTEKLEKHSQETKVQLAQLCQSVNAIHGMLFSATSANHRSSTTAAYEADSRHRRARFVDDHVLALARNEVLDAVFSFVGIGEYYYVAGVCRNWRG